MPFRQNLTLGLLVTITLEVVPFRAYAPFPALLSFFNCTLTVVFSESVQHRLRFFFDHLTSVSMAAFQFYLQSGKQKNVMWVGDNSHVFGETFPGNKESVRRCIVVIQ
jgi:hypothetical protein